MTNHIREFDEVLAPLRGQLKCLNVEFNVVCRKSGYYLLIDGSNTFVPPDSWETIWGTTFGKVMQNLVKPHMISQLIEAESDSTHACLYLGTVFDILKR